MDFKKACLKVRSVPVCLLFLIILSLSFIAWPMLPSSVEASPSVVVANGTPGNNALTDPTQTTDIAVSGNTIYATVKGIWCASKYDSAGILLKSTDGGLTWHGCSLPGTISDADYVAVAPDDPNFVVVVDNTGLNVGVSTSGGNTWAGLAQPPMTAINDVAVSPMAGGVRYIAIAGVAGGAGAVYYYNLGAVAPSWQNALSTPTWNNPPPSPDAFWAVKFSTNFLADYCILAVSSKNTQGVQLNIASFNTYQWNSAMDVTFPRMMTIDSNVVVKSVDITLDPNFYFGDPTTQVGFIGASITNNLGNEIGGVYRISTYSFIGGNLTMTQILTGIAIDSVAWDGTNLFAGSYAANIVYRSANSQAALPTFSVVSGDNAPGGEKNTLVAVSGTGVIAATSGSGSGISRSTDGGITFQAVLSYLFNSPVMVSPPHNATGITQNPAFSWQAVPYAALYRLELAMNSGFSNIVYTVDSSKITTEVPTTIKLTNGMTYYWRVKCLEPVESQWSSSFAFTVTPAPSTTVPPAPTTTIIQTSTPPPAETGGFPVAPVAGGVVGGIAAVSGGVLLIQNLITKKSVATIAKIMNVEKVDIEKMNVEKSKVEKTDIEKQVEKFKNSGVDIKVKNILGKQEIKSDTPLQAGKAFSLRLVQKPDEHAIDVKGPFILEVKEVK